MAIDTRLLAAMLPIAAATISRRREKVAPGHDFWEQVHAVAPEPIWRYILEVDAECQADLYNLNNLDDGAWLKRHHPALDDVLDGLAHAVQTYRGATIGPPLAYIQGWVIQQAYGRLGMVYATERPGAGVTTSIVIDRVVQERAAFDLLGWTVGEVHRQWSDPCAFAERWRSHLTVIDVQPPNVDMLAKAGLFDAELALLDAEGE